VEGSVSEVQFVPRSDGPPKPLWRNTMQGWIEEREPEGFAHVTLDDGFHMLYPADQWVVESNQEMLVEMAERCRANFLAAS
jgi:hypothetical protein